MLHVTKGHVAGERWPHGCFLHVVLGDHRTYVYVKHIELFGTRLCFTLSIVHHANR